MSALDHLRSLGTTTAQIADRLDRLGVKGYRYSYNACPVAVFLRHRGFTDVYVSQSYYRTAEDGQNDLPAVCRVFQDEFDNGRWPLVDACPPLNRGL